MRSGLFRVRRRGRQNVLLAELELRNKLVELYGPAGQALLCQRIGCHRAAGLHHASARRRSVSCMQRVDIWLYLLLLRI